MNKRVQRRELAHHLRDHIVQFFAIRHAIHQWQIAIANPRPIQSMHIAVVEIIALQPPGIEIKLMVTRRWVPRMSSATC